MPPTVLCNLVKCYQISTICLISVETERLFLFCFVATEKQCSVNTLLLLVALLWCFVECSSERLRLKWRMEGKNEEEAEQKEKYVCECLIKKTGVHSSWCTMVRETKIEHEKDKVRRRGITREGWRNWVRGTQQERGWEKRTEKRHLQRNLHVDQANPAAQEVLALLVDPVHNKEKRKGCN